MYFNVMTGLCNPDGSGLSGDEKAGDVLLLDFVEPFFNLHHLSLRGEDDEETRFIDIPLNEYQCAFTPPQRRRHGTACAVWSRFWPNGGTTGTS